MGRHLDGTKAPANVRDSVIDTLTTITGQKPVMDRRAEKSVANFKVREGYETAYEGDDSGGTGCGTSSTG